MEPVVVVGTPSRAGAPPPGARPARRVRHRTLFTAELVRAAVKQAFVMLRPDIQWKNPVMFVVEIGAFLTLLFIVEAALGASASQVSITYFIGLDFWLVPHRALREFRDGGCRGAGEGPGGIAASHPARHAGVPPERDRPRGDRPARGRSRRPI